MSIDSRSGVITYLRSFRIANMAIFDWVATILGALAVSAYFHYNFVIVLLILLIVSIVLHKLLDVKTYTNYYIGFDDEPDTKNE